MASEKISIIASDFQTQLSGAISVGASSFTLQSVTDSDGDTLTDGIYCFTIDRDNTSAKEYLVGQLTSATKTVSSVSSVDRQGNLTANAQKAHRIGANVIVSDHSILAAVSKIFRGVGKIDPAGPLEYDTAPTLSSATQIATKGYVDSVVTGGTVNTDRIILGSQTAGETVAAGNIVYFKSSDSRWWKADADLTTTFSNVQLGVALGAGTAGNTISGGVLIYGKCDSFTGLTATATYYLSNAAGAVATSAGTYSVILGQAFSTTGIFFNPGTEIVFFVSTSAGAADSGKVPKLNSSGLLDSTFLNAQTSVNQIVVEYASSPYTWTKDAGLKYIDIELWGGGGGGGTSTNQGAGGGGGYKVKERIMASALGATETVTIGAGGTAPAGAGGNTSFGSILIAYGGAGNSGDFGGAGGGGNATGGVDSGAADGSGVGGGNAIFGGGGGGSNTKNGGTSVYGGGGGGGDGGGTGGTSIYGGNGGGDDVAGSVPGGGGGFGKAGGNGRCIITEYYL